jgi:hypothetical protein
VIPFSGGAIGDGADDDGRRSQGQGQLFYEFRLAGVVPDDHLVRKIRALLDLSWAYGKQAPYYSEIGRPSKGRPRRRNSALSAMLDNSAKGT